MTVRMASGRSMSSFGLEVGDPVAVHGSTMDMNGGLIVSFGSAGRYEPSSRFRSPLRVKAEMESNLEVARMTGLALGNLSGLGGLLALGEHPREPAAGLNLFAAEAAGRIDRLVEAIRRGDSGSTRLAVRDLIGLGPGLTPSSDDVLGGMVLLMLLYSKNARAKNFSEEVARAIAKESRGRTTMLSEEYLRQAAAGRGNEPVVKLCEAILTGGREAVERETKSVLAIGGTSGTDTVLGIILGGWLCAGRVADLRGRIDW